MANNNKVPTEGNSPCVAKAGFTCRERVAENRRLDFGGFCTELAGKNTGGSFYA
ncbi:hypothetical protein [Geovibrio ferrireducens]|uniref:hypothetical protein n=1 Tax=Geovibrio ferrireducens TaxID=46201 RepID=UPI0022461531|nr:hypothetical protein [Geovibrio ferrireducens]